jgi:hypothetical protein
MAEFKQPDRHEDIVNARADREKLEIQARVNAFDASLGAQLAGIGLDPFSLAGGGPGSEALDPRHYARWLLEVGKSMGVAGQLAFHAKQTSLYAMNPETSRIWNPAYFMLRAPVLNSTTRLTIDEETHEDIVRIREVTEQKPNGREGTRENQNLYTESTAYSDSSFGGMGYRARGAVDPIDEKISDELAGLVVPSVAVFESARASVGFRQDPSVAAKAGTLSKRIESSKLARSAFAGRPIPQKFPGEGNDGLFRHSDVAETGLDDDDAYVPLSFTDLRRGPDGRYRTVYFRPFISSLTESIVPDWNEDAAFGRVDPIMTYKRTTRSLSIGFSLHAMSAADLKVMYNKLHWLTSMTMPEYDSELLIKSGPVCKMRVGDLMSGFSGVITSLEFDYSDALWEIEKDAKVPRSIDVSLGMTVLHDKTVGVFEGVFGGLDAKRGELRASSGGPLGIAVDATGPSSGVSVSRAAYRGFGEPVVLASDVGDE